MDAADEVLAGVVAGFDRRAEGYDHGEAHSAMHRELAEAVARFAELDGVGAVLDVATGTGLVLRALSALSALRAEDPPRLIGVDASPGMLAVARRELPEAELIEADVSALPLADASVDLISCVTALHIFQRPESVLGEWARVLAPGGRIVTASFVGTPHGHGPGSALSELANHADYATPEALGRVFAPHGFAVTRHEAWQHGDDRILIAELARTA